MFLFADNKHLYLHEERIHLLGGGYVAPPPFCSSPVCGSAWGYVILKRKHCQLQKSKCKSAFKMLYFSSQWLGRSLLCLFAGLQSGFVTLPRLSRLTDRQFQDGEVHRGSLTDSGGTTRTRSDSLTSFTIDLGPSLMTEVLNLIDNPSCLQTSSHGEEEEREEKDDSSLVETPVQSPSSLASPNSSVCSGSFIRDMNNRGHFCGSNWPEQDKERRSVQKADVCSGSPQREEPAMEPERFQRAADVLSRHYGGGSFSKGMRTSTAVSQRCKSQYAFSEEEEEEEEEIKV